MPTIASFAVKTVFAGYALILMLLIPVLLLSNIFPKLISDRISVILLESFIIFIIAAFGEVFSGLLTQEPASDNTYRIEE